MVYQRNLSSVFSFLLTSRLNPFGLIVALKYGSSGMRNEDGYAKGHLYWDDGESLDSISKDKYNLFDLSVQQVSLFLKILIPSSKALVLSVPFAIKRAT